MGALPRENKQASLEGAYISSARSQGQSRPSFKERYRVRSADLNDRSRDLPYLYWGGEELKKIRTCAQRDKLPDRNGSWRLYLAPSRLQGASGSKVMLLTEG